MEAVVEYTNEYVSDYDMDRFIEILVNKFKKERENENLN